MQVKTRPCGMVEMLTQLPWSDQRFADIHWPDRKIILMLIIGMMFKGILP